MKKQMLAAALVALLATPAFAQNIAVVNELVFPAKVPLSFSITSDTVMTSFFIPQLGSQIYAMGGMRTIWPGSTRLSDFTRPPSTRT